jgi:hypothetical protein
MLEGMGEILQNLDRLTAQMERQAAAAADEAAMFMESYAKSIAPWTDRTSNLRNSITGSSSRVPSGYRMVVSESMVYGPFVEHGHFAKRNTTRMSTRKSGATVQRISDRAYGTWVRARPALWPTVAYMANSGTALAIFKRHLEL